jgi:hypothetical protein
MTSSEDDVRIAEIAARAEAATAGPWNVTEMEGHWISGAGYVQGMTYYVFEAEQRGDGECGSMLKEDAEFVAASREDVPWLLAQLAASEAARARLVEALQMIRDRYGKVCDEFELCQHTACDSSVGSWMEADAALTDAAGQGGAGEEKA